MTPTRIYVRPVMDMLSKYRASVHGMVHITGGGFYENVPRMFKKAAAGEKQLVSVFKRGSWEVPAIFAELIRRGADESKIYNTFNMGIGFMLAVKAEDADAIVKHFNDNASKFATDVQKSLGIQDMKAYKIGRVAASDKAIEGDLKGSTDAVIFED